MKIYRLGIVLIVALALSAPLLAQKAPLIVVVNSSRPETNLSRLDLLTIFLGKGQYWADRSQISVILPPNDDLVANLVFYEFLGTPRNKLKAKWTAKVSQREVRRMPDEPKTTADALSALARNDGGILVVSQTALDGYPGADQFKVLLIDGRAPGTDGYALAR